MKIVKWGNTTVGLLGTISFHLLVIILFLLFRINGERQRDVEGIELDLKTLEELAMMEFETQSYPDQQDRQARNIAVDQNEDRIERFEDYQNYRMSGQSVSDIVKDRIQQDVNDIIKDNGLNPDDRELPDIATQPLDLYAPKELEEDQVYEGPTNIYFSLEGRKITKLIVPVYKCESAGLVQLDIRVNRRGRVEFVALDNATSTTKDPCLVEAAKDAARRTLFNFAAGAPMLQSGSITFRFVAQ